MGIPFRTRADSFPSSPAKEVLLPQRGIPTQPGPCFHAVRIHFLLFFCIIIRFSGLVFLRLFPKSVHVCQPNIPFSAFYVGTKDVFLSFSHHRSAEKPKIQNKFPIILLSIYSIKTCFFKYSVYLRIIADFKTHCPVYIQTISPVRIPPNSAAFGLVK